MTENNKPLVTFALFAYNQEKYIREAIEGAFSQTYSPLEIILSDDCSSDKTFEIMQEMAGLYKGPHKVVINKNEANMGIGEHVNKVGRELAKGELIVLAAGDDISVSERVHEIVRYWFSIGKGTVLLYSNFLPVDQFSNVVELKGEKIYKGPHDKTSMSKGNIRVLGATTAYTKDIFEKFLPMDPSVIHEDRVLPFRVLLLSGKVEFIDQYLVKYRVFGGISRGKPISAHDLLYRTIPSLARRTLPDANQRIKDVELLFPFNKELQRNCRSAISRNKYLIAMAESKKHKYETVFLRSLLDEVDLGFAIKTYLKFRFFIFFRFYFERRMIH